MPTKTPDEYEAELRERAADTNATGHLALSAATGVGILRAGTNLFAHIASTRQTRRSDALLRRIKEYVDEGIPPAPGSPEAENYEDVLFEAYRSAIFALDEAVIPAIARLVALYAGGRKADAFFRGVGTLLEGLDAERFSALDALLATMEGNMQHIGEPTEDDLFVCFYAQNEQPTRSALRMAWGSRFHKDSFAIETSRQETEQWQEVFRRMSSNEVVREREPGIGSHCFYASPSTLDRLTRVVRG